MTALLNRGDIDFAVFDWLELHSRSDRETVEAFLDLSEKVAEESFLSHYKLADVDEPGIESGEVRICAAVKDALAQYAELGLFGAGFPERLGGIGLSQLACTASSAYFSAANIATSGYVMLTVANARLLAAFGTDAHVEAFARPQIEGRWFGTMCLSEPQAGSSLADIRTCAEFDEEDDLGKRYRLFGNKMWISGGDQDASENIVHLVLAKVRADDGSIPDDTRGLSLFVVPKLLPDGATNDIAVAGLNHKLGYRGTSNCALNFGEDRGAIGWIVGSPGDGLRQMFQMMNEARIAVGLGAAALGYRAYLLSLDYAKERKQGRAPGSRGGAPVAIVEHADVKRMLLTQKAYVEGAMALCLYCAHLVDLEDSEGDHQALLGLLTPIAKTWPSEYALAANDLAIQIHGGYGYTREYHVEQLWRDNRLNAIHEGTTGIQASDLVGRKILRDDAGLAALKRRILATLEAAETCPEHAEFKDALEQALRKALAAADYLRSQGLDRAIENAAPCLRGFGHVVVAWLMLDQLVCAGRLADKTRQGQQRYAGKLAAYRQFYVHDLPKIGIWLSTDSYARSDYGAIDIDVL